MTGERLGIAHIDQPLEQLERVVERLARFEAADDAEGQERASAPAEIFPRQSVIGIIGKAGVVDPFDPRIAAQEFGNAPRVLDVALDAQRHRFDALQQQEGRQRRQHGAGGALIDAAAARNVGGGTEVVYTEHFGSAAYIARCRSVYQRTTGAVLAPFSAFLLLQGIETVALRVERHVDNARRVAEFLRRDRGVAWVNYAGFADHPYHALAQKYLGGRACSILTFGIEGGFEAGKAFYDALKLFKRLVNMGDAKSLACHPASTTHRQMSAEEHRRAGVKPEMIRLSIGIEHIDDIIADLDQALAASQSPRSALIAAE